MIHKGYILLALLIITITGMALSGAPWWAYPALALFFLLIGLLHEDEMQKLDKIHVLLDEIRAGQTGQE